jgi:hypothetical protein
MDVGVQNAIIRIRSAGEQIGIPRWLRGVSTAFGTLGLIGSVLPQADRPLYNSDGGAPERIALYTTLVFELMLGTLLLAAPPRQNSSLLIHERLAS